MQSRKAICNFATTSKIFKWCSMPVRCPNWRQNEIKWHINSMQQNSSLQSITYDAFGKRWTIFKLGRDRGLKAVVVVASAAQASYPNQQTHYANLLLEITVRKSTFLCRYRLVSVVDGSTTLLYRIQANKYPALSWFLLVYKRGSRLWEKSFKRGQFVKKSFWI